jgi:hypothetical protein
MAQTFKEAVEALVNPRIEQGDDPMDVFDEFHGEANAVFGHYQLEFELALIEKERQPC